MMLAVEVGGSSVQAISFDEADRGSVVSLDEHRHDEWLLAAPGLVEGDRVRGAHHLDWMDVRASEELGMHAPPVLGMNDADAAAFGEWALRGQPPGTLLYISMGTGVGATAVNEGRLIPIEFGHLTAFGPNRCDGCGRVGCLDAQIGGHTLPTPLGRGDIAKIVAVLRAALAKQEIEVDRVVVGGGLPRRYPQVVSSLAKHTNEPVEPSASPARYKSAAPFGLLRAWSIRSGEDGG
jgi:predicted NBD/HSP70 family sugar kinase